MEKTEDANVQNQIGEIKMILKEIKDEQQKMENMIQKNYSVVMKKLMKLQEYNQIEDMTNQIFERRLCSIEEAVIKNSKRIIMNRKGKKCFLFYFFVYFISF